MIYSNLIKEYLHVSIFKMSFVNVPRILYTIYFSTLFLYPTINVFKCLVGALLNAIIAKILKKIIKEERPIDRIENKTLGYGMPSSHSCSLFYAIVWLHYHESIHIYYIYVMYIIICIECWSRIYRRFHTWKQIIAGSILGTLFSLLFSVTI